MRGRLLMALTLCAAILAAVALPVAAQDYLLPDGPGRDTTAVACGACHGLEILPGAPRSPLAWNNTMLRMMNRGMKISSEDYVTVATYLATYLSLSPPPASAPALSEPAPSP